MLGTLSTPETSPEIETKAFQSIVFSAIYYSERCMNMSDAFGRIIQGQNEIRCGCYIPKKLESDNDEIISIIIIYVQKQTSAKDHCRNFD
jgi:hypothetical protein